MPLVDVILLDAIAKGVRVCEKGPLMRNYTLSVTSMDTLIS